MKKNKNRSDLGFTMVELLAVIVLMGILFAIAIPAVTKYINKSKKASFETALKTSYEAAENYMMDNDTAIILPVGGNTEVTLSELTRLDYMENVYDTVGEQKLCSDNAESKVTITRTADTEGGLANYRYDVVIHCPDSGYYYYTYPNDGLLEPVYRAARNYIEETQVNPPQTFTIPTLVSNNYIKADSLKNASGDSCNVNTSTVTVTRNGNKILYTVHLVCGAETLDAKFSV